MAERKSVARAIVRMVDDAQTCQALQLEVLRGELVEGAERFQGYGLTSVPFPGDEAAVAFVGGRRAHPLVLGLANRAHRPTGLAPGEIALYTDEGTVLHSQRGRHTVVDADRITLTASTEVRIQVGSSSIVVTPSGITITGDAVDFEEP